MRFSKLMKERIRRVRVLFKELGYLLIDGDKNEESYSSAFENQSGFQGGIFIDSDNNFLEMAFTFSFSPEFGPVIQNDLEDMLKICYEFGVYFNIVTGENDIEFSAYSKIYYAGLNYFALRETLRDFQDCVEALKALIEITEEVDPEEPA